MKFISIGRAAPDVGPEASDAGVAWHVSQMVIDGLSEEFQPQRG